MAREQTFIPGTVVPSTFLNDRQDLESALTFIRVEIASPSAIRVPVVTDGSTSGQTPAIIGGQPRVNTTPYVLGLTTAGQGSQPITYDVYATLQGTTITGTGGYGFVLQLVGRSAGTPYGGTPGAVPASSRKVAELDWSGGTIVALRNTVEVAGHAGMHAYGLPNGLGDPLPAKSIDVSQLMPSVTNKQAFPGDLKMSVAAADHGPRGDGTFEWVLISPGRRLSQASYPTLYAAMGNPALDGSGTFALPAVNDRALVGAGTKYPFGTTWGTDYYPLQNAEMPQHAHGNATGPMDRNNPHGHITTETAHNHTLTDPQHTHDTPNLNTTASSKVVIWTSSGQGNSWIAPGTAAFGTSHPSSTGITLAAQSTGLTINANDINHLHAIGPDGGDPSNQPNAKPHENRQPSIALNVFLKT